MPTGVAYDLDDFAEDCSRSRTSLSTRLRSRVELAGALVTASVICVGARGFTGAAGDSNCRRVADFVSADGDDESIAANCSSAVSGGSPAVAAANVEFVAGEFVAGEFVAGEFVAGDSDAGDSDAGRFFSRATASAASAAARRS